MIVTLRIKKFWFDEIRSGRKLVEYRVASKFNSDRFKTKPDVLKLHYQGLVYLLCEVKSIRRVKIDGRAHFAIDLGKVIYQACDRHLARS